MLATATPRSRQAFLLRTVEGFAPEEVAKILSITPAEVEALIAEAGREIAQRVATDVLIIEDEGLIAQDIQFICEDLGHRVIGVARTHGEALELAKTAKFEEVVKRYSDFANERAFLRSSLV